MKTEDLLSERGKTHGNYTAQATTSDILIRAMERTPNWHALEAPHRDALRMVAVKVSRILNGDPHHKDSWEDIAGYATLAAKECKIEKKTL